MNILKQSTAATIKLGPFIDDTDGKTAETGLTIAQADIRLSKNGGDFAQTNNTAGATHDENGYYDIPLNATDTGTLGRLRIAVSESGALPVWQDFLVVTANVYDTLCSTDSLDVNVTALADDVITAGKFDESTAFPLKSADADSTKVARVGADSDTLETLSDQLDAVKTETAAILTDTGTTLDTLIKDIPTVAEFNARTKPTADYFDPSADTVANVTTVGTTTNLTNLPTMPADWLTASGLKVDAVTEIQNGLAKSADLQDVEDKIDVIATDTTTEIPASITALSGKVDTIDNFLDTEIAAILEDTGATLPATLAAIEGKVDTADAVVDLIKAKTDNLPASPAATGAAMTLTAAYDKAKDDVLTPLGVVDGIVDAIKLKTDTIPASPAPANEYDARMTAIQADLDNPAQYKADVSGLATATDLATVDGIVDAIKAKTDLIPASPASAGEYTAAIGAIPTAPLLAANYVAPDNASVGAIKTKTDQLVFTTPNKVDASATIDPTGLATSAALATVDGIVDAIKLQTDQLTFTVANKVDASATVDPTGIATSAEMAALDDKVDAIKAKTDNLPASPAATGAAMTLTAAYDKAKDDVLTPLGVVDGIVDAIKAKSDLIPATPAATGEYDADVTQIVELLYTILGGEGWTDETLVTIQAAIDAIKAKTDSIPASPAVAGEYTASIAAIQADLDNPDQYKADVSGIPDAILAKVIVGTLTLEQVLKVLAAVEIGITTGGGTETIVYTGIDGTIIRLTGVDENGNRTAVIVTPGA